MFPISSVVLRVPAPILILPWIIGMGTIENLLDLTKGSVIIWGLERRTRFGFQIFQGGLKCPLLRASTWKKRWPTPSCEAGGTTTRCQSASFEGQSGLAPWGWKPRLGWRRGWPDSRLISAATCTGYARMWYRAAPRFITSTSRGCNSE